MVNDMAFHQTAYIDHYNKEKYKLFQFRIRREDEEILKKLDSVANRNAYIVSLLNEDIRPSVLSLKRIRAVLREVLPKHNINEAYLFGSYARGEANSNSDIDIYCEPGDIKTLIDQGRLEEELEEALGKKVDIVFFGTVLEMHFQKQLDEDKIRLC